MRKADRLFQIIQILRRENRPITADAIADELETSKRSVYRDIAALVGQRVPIRGEAGVGYILEGGFDLPPLMLTAAEADAVALGLQWVVGHTDPDLARAGRDVLAKLATVLPDDVRLFLEDPSAGMPPAWQMEEPTVDMSALRGAIRQGRKMRISYASANGRQSERTIWPLFIGYLDSRRILIAWCELREGFRNFRLDRVIATEFLDERVPKDPASLRRQWRATLSDPQRLSGAH